MASTSSGRPSSSYSAPRRKYEVFINFCGRDTRHGFTGHLYDALERENIVVFKDTINLPRGNPISLRLVKAIKESQYAIVVLSENYAHSRWCLDELVTIVECMSETGQTVLPVFYNVNPSHVHNQTGPFANDIALETSVNDEKMQKWRDALRLVVNLAGFHLNKRQHLTFL